MVRISEHKEVLVHLKGRVWWIMWCPYHSSQTFCSFPRAVDASNNLLLISLMESFDGVSVTPRYLNRLTWSRDVSSSLMLTWSWSWWENILAWVFSMLISIPYFLLTSCTRSILVGGGTRMARRGIRLVHHHEKHPKHVFSGLNFASLNKYSSGIWHPKHVFCSFFNPKQVIMQ